MEKSAYAVEAEVEASHWWFVGRRNLFGRLIDGISLERDARILDIGTSTGTNLRMLHELGFKNFEGIDASEEAVRWCTEKRLGKVSKGDVCKLPFPDSTFDLVLATDIVEHVEDDALAIAEIRRVLKPGSKVIITVPAFQALWGLQDTVSHHKRRYRSRTILKLIRQAGLTCEVSFYFNYLLFVPILIARQIIKLCGFRLRNENRLNSPFVNTLLARIFALDIRLAPVLRAPFGVSFLVVAQRGRAVIG